jgi:hypothetical protein
LAADNVNRDQPYLVRFVNAKVESFGRFAQLFDIYNRPVNGTSPMMGYGNPMMSPLATAPAATSHVDLADQLQKLKTLKDQGAITDEEFQRAKNLLLQTGK